MERLSNFLFRQVDNSPLILFRILFGALMFFEGVGGILTGWVKETYVDPTVTFNFIGFDFLQVLVGPQMYAVYIILSLLGLLIMIGWHYRIAITAFSILWAVVYLAQKSHYNNHYYLLLLISVLLILVPAERNRSMDSIRNGASYTCPYWCIFIFQLQIAIVYFYAAIAKVYPDWLHARPIGLWFTMKSYTSILWDEAFAHELKQFFSKRSVHYFISYTGIFFDLLVIPAFIWKRTRTLALVASISFHLMNSILFQIGVFPYFALSFVIFFYPRETIRRLFFPKRPVVDEESFGANQRSPNSIPKWSFLLLIFFMFQLFLPLRHWRIPGDVLWTEEGHRLSWRMMLRSRAGYARVRVVNTDKGLNQTVNLSNYLSRKQMVEMSTKPDMMWQFAQIIEEEYISDYDVDDVAVYINSKVGVNGRSVSQFSNPDIDLTSVRWNRFGHQTWIMEKPF